MPHTVVATFHIKPENIKDFTKILQDPDQGLTLTRKWDGCVSIECYKIVAQHPYYLEPLNREEVAEFGFLSTYRTVGEEAGTISFGENRWSYSRNRIIPKK